MLYPSTFADIRFSWRIGFYGCWPKLNMCQNVHPCNWGFIWGSVSPSLWGPGTMCLKTLAISLIPGFKIAFQCIFWWTNLFFSWVSFSLHKTCIARLNGGTKWQVMWTYHNFFSKSNCMCFLADSNTWGSITKAIENVAKRRSRHLCW